MSFEYKYLRSSFEYKYLRLTRTVLMMIELDLSSYTLELSNFQELKTSSIQTVDKCFKKELFIESRKSEI